MTVYRRTSQLSIQQGITTITTDANGRDTITMPSAFPSSNFVATANLYGSGSAYAVQVFSRPSSSTFVVQLSTGTAAVGSGITRNISWIAMMI